METRLGRLCEIPEGGARGYRVARADGVGAQRILVWRAGDAVRAYLNRCPHRGTPLDWVEDHFMDADARHLVCATHGAIFRPQDGHCLAGPCAGDRLAPVEVAVRDGDLYLVQG